MSPCKRTATMAMAASLLVLRASNEAAAEPSPRRRRDEIAICRSDASPATR
jgi:hypothetical protein